MSEELNRATAKRLARSVAIDAQATDCHYEHIFTELQIAQKRGEVIGRRMEPLRAVYERFKHLDPVFATIQDDDMLLFKTARDLWLAVKAALGIAANATVIGGTPSVGERTCDNCRYVEYSPTSAPCRECSHTGHGRDRWEPNARLDRQEEEAQ